MKLPMLHGLIRRRILVNFRVAPDVMQRLLPKPFRPKLLGEWAMAGICLIRLERLRPTFLSLPIGFSSENAAHRVAVTWTDGAGQPQEGVYIPRRDSGSLLNRWVGGRLFPGEHNAADFDVEERDDAVRLSMRSRDGKVAISLRGRCDAGLPETSQFASVAEASSFYERGAIGYSARAKGDRFDGLRLVTQSWRVEPLKLEEVQSSYFADESLFPKGSVQFDCALLMRNIEHEWKTVPELKPA
jgi:hypothetical protein